MDKSVDLLHVLRDLDLVCPFAYDHIRRTFFMYELSNSADLYEFFKKYLRDDDLLQQGSTTEISWFVDVLYDGLGLEKEAEQLSAIVNGWDKLTNKGYEELSELQQLQEDYASKYRWLVHIRSKKVNRASNVYHRICHKLNPAYRGANKQLIVLLTRKQIDQIENIFYLRYQVRARRHQAEFVKNANELQHEYYLLLKPHWTALIEKFIAAMPSWEEVKRHLDEVKNAYESTLYDDEFYEEI